jgi:hypothetical protein
MFTLERRTITSLVVSFGLYAWFDVKNGEAPSSVWRTVPTRASPRFESRNSPTSRWRRSRRFAVAQVLIGLDWVT